MSSNNLAHDKSNTLLNSERKCLNSDMSKNLVVKKKTNLHDDKCYLDIQTVQSMNVGAYQLDNNYHCDCLIPETVNNATNNPLMFFKNGHDVNPCVIDESSQLRLGKTKKNPRCPDQLFERPYLTVPFMGRGSGNTTLESQLFPGEDTSVRKECNTLSGVTIPHLFTPLIGHLAENIQNPEKLITEVAEEGWIRGGAPSRLIVRDVDYLQRCGYEYLDKETNSDFWENKHQFL
jgi:hypothetical protein